MTTLREAAQQALEALEEFGTHYEHCPRYPTWTRPELQPPCNCGFDRNVAALRDALVQEEQEQEPAAWMDDFGNAFPLGAVKGAGSWRDDHQRNWTPLYTHPPVREWKGLTTKEAMFLADTVPKGVFYGCEAGTGLGIWIAAVEVADKALRSKNNE